ncbi:MAG: fructosamine kinase family protein [Chitinophagaceae bacterium]
MPLHSILDDCGLTITKYEPVHGGDINRSYCLYTRDAKYFLKVNDATLYPGMFEKEAKGLEALAQNVTTIRIPQVIKYGLAGQDQYLLLEWMETGKPGKDSMEKFGAAVATMHRQIQPYFGWEEDNYIGSLPQYNTKYDSWSLFYSECRISPLVQLLFNGGAFSKQDIVAVESFCKKLNYLFPQEPPALLHGDLWAGNFMIASKGDAAIYDPAVYYGHREMEIGMTKLFGGFDQRFYDAYSENYPLEKNWLERIPLTQLYPVLVHAILFGGHYVAKAKEIIKPFSQ